MSAWRHEALVPIGSSAPWQTRFPLAPGKTGDPTVCKQGVLFPYAVRYTGSQRGLVVAKNSPGVGQEILERTRVVFSVLITGGSVVSGIFQSWRQNSDRQAVSLRYDVYQ